VFRRKPPPVPEAVEWMIAGLGNPGPEYRGTRHNVGFTVVELLAERHKIKLNRGRNRAMVGTGALEGHSVALVKPMTFMNLSGQALSPLMKQMGLKPSHVLVIADDLDLPLGKLRLRAKGSSGGHNGHKSVAASLQTTEYPRLKIGIDCVDKGRTIDHVLSTFDRNEREIIDRAIVASAEICEAVSKGDWEEALRLVESHNKA
jgi:PTH1 family peptidyl-tRNA hydrolase